MATRIFLTFVGAAYLGFSLWCALRPAETAAAVGFTLRAGGGQSEYFTVYGGLQFALACVFLLPWLRPEAAATCLLVCVLVHGSLVLFRAISLALYGDPGATTLTLAGLELALFLAAGAIWWTRATPSHQ